MTNFGPTIPLPFSRVEKVKNFEELLGTPFAEGVNALCWERTLAGDFGEIARQINASEGITALDEARLLNLPVSPGGQRAVAELLEDLRRLREHGLAPELNCIRGYPRDENPAVVPIDVYSFHADSAPIQADTWLCTYFGAPSEGLRNEESQRRVDVPETRAALLELFGGEDGPDFHAFLKDHCYDLHYAPLPQARPYSFGVGNLWRIAVDYPGSPVAPCIHRAPTTLDRDPPRLLLIS